MTAARVGPTLNPQTNPVGRLVRVNDRWWKLLMCREWAVQCRRCAKYKKVANFAAGSEGAPSLLCNHCAQYRRMGRTASPRSTARTAPTTRVCSTCRQSYPVEEFRINLTTPRLHRECPTCREQVAISGLSQGGLLAVAEQEIVPGLKDYDVPLAEIRANPEKYPGVTYWDLTRDQREAIIARAKELVFQYTGKDFRDKSVGAISRFDLRQRDAAEGLSPQESDSEAA